MCGDSHTSHARGVWRAGVRHRHQRGRACAGHPDPATTQAKGHGGARRGRPAAGVSAKDIILSDHRPIGIDGGVGHVIEYTGSAIRALSMEGRMTVCNMSIEAGARAGMIAPDDTTFAYFEGRPLRAEGAGLGPGARRLARAARPTPARPTTRVVRSTGRSSYPTSPGAPTRAWSPPIDRPGARPGRRSLRGRPPRARAGAELHGPEAANTRFQDIAARSGLYRLLHQRPHRGSARRRDSRRGNTSIRGFGPWWCPARTGQGRRRSRKASTSVQPAGFEWREAGCSMCLGMNPDILLPGERCAST